MKVRRGEGEGEGKERKGKWKVCLALARDTKGTLTNRWGVKIKPQLNLEKQKIQENQI